MNIPRCNDGVGDGSWSMIFPGSISTVGSLLW
jgi:hypothetical protein